MNSRHPCRGLSHVTKLILVVVVESILTGCSPAQLTNDNAIFSGRCQVPVTTGLRQKLIEKIRSGHAASFACALEHASLFDGGDLEDLYIAGAAMLEHSPEAFCRISLDEGRTKDQIAEMAASLSFDLVDDTPAQREALSSRLMLVQKDPLLAVDVCRVAIISGLNSRLEDLESAQ